MDPGDLVRVLLVGADHLANHALADAVAAAGGEVVGAIGPADDVRGVEAVADVDVVLWDLGPGGEPDARRWTPLAAPILVLTTADEAARAVGAGAWGVIVRDGDPVRLRAALRAAVVGLRVVDDRLAHAVLRGALAPPEGHGLTRREAAVLDLVADGLSNREIADELGISEHTVRSHVDAARAKTGARTRTEAVVVAARWGWLTL